MTQDEKNSIKIELFKDKLLFGSFLLPHHFSLKPAEFHRKVYNQLEGSKRNAIAAPRGHAKTTLISLNYVLWKILFCEVNFVVIISDTYTQAKLFIDAIKRELETNEKIRFYFGDLVGRTWGESEIETKTEIKILGRGAGQRVRGLKHKEHRPDLILLDDIENDEAVSTGEQRDKLEHWFFGSVLPALSDNGELDVIGTILHYDSLLNKLLKNPAFTPSLYRAIEGGEPLWKEKFSIEKLENIKESYASQGLLDTYFCEYMNEPLSDENAIFKQSWFKYYDDDPAIINSLEKFITVDLAISQKESADYTVVMVTGVDALNQIYVLEYVHERIDPITTIRYIMDLADKWNVFKIGIESVAYQKSLIWYLQDEMKKRDKFYIIEELKADMDKERRIRGLQPRYATGAVFHKPTMTALEEELLRFPKSAHDDLADALAYVPQIKLPGASSSKLPEPKHTGRLEAATMVEGGGFASY